jgi:hypothetical protein
VNAIKWSIIVILFAFSIFFPQRPGRGSSFDLFLAWSALVLIGVLTIIWGEPSPVRGIGVGLDVALVIVLADRANPNTRSRRPAWHVARNWTQGVLQRVDFALAIIGMPLWILSSGAGAVHNIATVMTAVAYALFAIEALLYRGPGGSRKIPGRSWSRRPSG